MTASQAPGGEDEEEKSVAPTSPVASVVSSSSVSYVGAVSEASSSGSGDEVEACALPTNSDLGYGLYPLSSTS